ncbi:hypothetical protein EJ05DRAFT_474700 [Pseudovirgaria hyperparasitica]|uniref:Uncharacterized protein n=1 Tax=Pseudovirgaria hyperparasitica TaxID=470096 RepID=A0A6A6WET2_9PEZI|nr:uncharacterized protein EJ05DRAFT_474700 [Pseudovirgaria hyperparasitica]KAF2759621.1 hypothetical protein EJ05DRAFT_474700 [Pseudovirgaria hyperparasitica]
MEGSTPRTPTSRSSRRSIPNLANLNIAPLSSAPLEPSSPSPTDAALTSPHTSYIQHKSAPNTPGVLSLSQSRASSHHRRHPKYTHAGNSYFPTAPPSPTGTGTLTAPITSSQSASALHQAGPLDARGRIKAPQSTPATAQASKPPKSGHKRAHTTTTAATTVITADWLHRAGLAIASQTRDQKGQTWLVARDSSTALAVAPSTPDVDHHHHHAASLDQALLARTSLDREPGSAWNSRAGSRAQSALNSRRGSRVASRAELGGVGAGAGSWAGVPSYAASGATSPVMGPDFVDLPGEDTADGYGYGAGNGSNGGEDEDGEEVVAKLTREGTLGLGGWVDRLVGWTLFRVAEDGEDDDDDGDEDENENDEDRRTNEAGTRNLKMVDGEALRTRTAELEAARRRRERDREAINAASAKAVGTEFVVVDDDDVDKKADGQSAAEGGWQDAAWLLSVASKVLL